MSEQGPDWSKFNGSNPAWGLTSDSFAIAQIGGTYGGQLNLQVPYAAQVRSVRSRGRRAHAYIWFQVGGSQAYAKRVLDYLLPKIGLPKGAIVALDYEAGASSSVFANTNAILYGMRRIKQAGYTPMYYSYKPYTLAHVDYKSIVHEFGTCLWIASYPFIHAVSKPDMRYFPSMEGIAIWQFTNKYAHESGLDGNVDLTGITWNGYRKASPAVKAIHKKEIVSDMPEAKYWPATVAGIAYARNAATTYYDNARTKPRAKLEKDKPYKVFEIRNDSADVGTQWVHVTDVLIALNPLVEGFKTEVHNAKPVKLSTGRTIAAGSYPAFGIHGKQIDLGGGQTAPANEFTVLL